jgi:ElaA protein
VNTLKDFDSKSSSIFWEQLTWSQLSSNQLYSLMQLRQAVFVVEQQCVYQDADGLDPHSTHLLAWQDRELVACARIVPATLRFATVSIGRVVTAYSVRRQGLGRELIKRCLASCDAQGTDPITISAQRYLELFYASFGFKTSSQPYLEDGIEHVEMVRSKPAMTHHA